MRGSFFGPRTTTTFKTLCAATPLLRARRRVRGVSAAMQILLVPRRTLSPSPLARQRTSTFSSRLGRALSGTLPRAFPPAGRPRWWLQPRTAATRVVRGPTGGLATAFADPVQPQRRSSARKETGLAAATLVGGTVSAMLAGTTV